MIIDNPKSTIEPAVTPPKQQPAFKRLVWSRPRRRLLFLTLVILLMATVSSVAYFMTRGNRGAMAPIGGHQLVTSNAADNLNLPDCGSSKQLLANSPVAIQDLSTIIPMGNFAPPGHIGPTPHMYYNFINTGTGDNPQIAKTNIYAPANMVITKISLFDNASSRTPFNSYRLDFAICKQVTGYFIHTLALADKLAAVMKPPYDNVQSSAITGTITEHVYSKNTNIKVSAGEQVATAGGNSSAPWGLDFGLVDQRTPLPTLANPARWKYDSHYVCSLDYYPPALSASLYAHIGDYSYRYLNPGDPKCGLMYQGLPGTAQGVWFTRDVPSDVLGDPAMEITLAQSNLNHAQQVFSLGGKLQSIGISTNGLYSFTPQTSGTIDTDFSLVKPGGIYCYQLQDPTDYSRPDTIILLQLKDSNTLDVGKAVSSSCGVGTWTMPANAIEYIR